MNELYKAMQLIKEAFGACELCIRTPSQEKAVAFEGYCVKNHTEEGDLSVVASPTTNDAVVLVVS